MFSFKEMYYKRNCVIVKEIKKKDEIPLIRLFISFYMIFSSIIHLSSEYSFNLKMIFFFHLLQALTKYQTSQKVTTKTGIEQEETLLNESAARETSLNLQILDLENEVKQLRHELERVRNERDRMLQENSDIGRDKSDNEAEKIRLKAELKELKFRETRMLTEYSELEEENISLQKQVSSLRSSQVG